MCGGLVCTLFCVLRAVVRVGCVCVWVVSACGLCVRVGCVCVWCASVSLRLCCWGCQAEGTAVRVPERQRARACVCGYVCVWRGACVGMRVCVRMQVCDVWFG